LLPGPFTVPVDEEVESQHLKFIQNPPPGMTFGEAVSRMNCNISYSGLLHAVTADVSISADICALHF
jgi:DnaJ homolog subfamily C member 13